jgi:quercetin dioxygenase-like cupin family protein
VGRLHRDPDRDLTAGRLLVIAPGLAHDVEAVADSAFTLARGAQG